jgi:hypothetical protein
MGDDVYVKLREFMNTLPAGYPSTPSRVEIRILKKLFSPEEAELTMQLKNEPEEVPVIAARLGLEEAQLAQRLEKIAQKGLISESGKKIRTSTRHFSSWLGFTNSRSKTWIGNFARCLRSIFPILECPSCPLKPNNCGLSRWNRR